MKKEKTKKVLKNIGFFIIVYPVLYFVIKFDGLHTIKNSDVWWTTLICEVAAALFIFFLGYLEKKRRKKVKKINKENEAKRLDEEYNDKQ